METKQNETKQVEQKKGKPAKRKWKNPFTSNRFKRGGMSTLLSVVFIAIVVAVNVGVTALTDRFPSLDIDMTAQGLNTLSDQAIEIAQSIDEDTTIYLIGTEEGYDSNQIYASYGLEYSQVANLAFANSSTTFAVEGAPIADNAVVAELGLAAWLTPRQQLELGYSGQFGSESRDHGATARWSVRF